MKRKIKFYQIDAFTNKIFEGNAAAVTFGEELSNEEMQQIANEMNLSETAFITGSSIADYKLRWFTPLTEVDLCGHATIASIHYLNELNKIKDRNLIKFETRSGVLSCKIDNEKYYMEIPKPIIEPFDCCKEEIISALNIDRNSIPDDKDFLLANNSYLYIYCDSLEALKNAKVNYNELLDISTKNNFHAVTVFTDETFEDDSFVHSRFFAPALGVNEDPVTGSSNGPLILILNKLGMLNFDDNEISKIFEQGDIIGRKGRVIVTFNPKSEKIFIGGNAVTVLTGDLNL